MIDTVESAPELRLSPNRTMPRTVVYAALAFAQFHSTIAPVLSQTRSSALGPLLLFVAVWLWLDRDRRHFPEVAARYDGLALAVLWPVLMPLYHAETRGPKRTLARLGLGMGVVLLSTALAILVLALAR